MSRKKKFLVLIVLVAVIWLIWRLIPRSPEQDEAMARGIPVTFFDQAANEPDFFRELDGGLPLTQEQVRGRNTWMVWTGGNEAFWDYLASNSFGTFDLLKTISSFPCSPQQEANAAAFEQKTGKQATPGDYDGQGYDWAYPGVCKDDMYPKASGGPFRAYSRDSRFCFTGLVNEPGFRKASKPDQYGLCLDERVASNDPFDPKVYGRPTGVLGLRIYDNPNFDDKAKKRWMEAMKSDGFYTNPDFFFDKNLVRPYRVGMACSFCHVSPHPNSPPADPENPQFANLSATIGAQYFWFGRIFAPNVTSDNFVWHLLDTQRPGAVDTSFVPADNLNNPRAMNALFYLGERLANGTRMAPETSAGGALLLPEVAKQKDNDYTFGVPHVLWDGADSVGIDAALTRVYINIGEYHQEWVKHINLILGAVPQSPITVKAAQENSIYWQATQKRSADLAKYLVAASRPMPLAQTPGGAAYLAGGGDAAAHGQVLDRGKVLFAETCARCHSSKLPAQPASQKDIPRIGEKGCIGEGYGECFQQWWDWTNTPEFKSQMTALVRQPDFLANNYLSNDVRIPVSLLKTETCSSMASNAIEGHVWDNFASASYKSLPDVGEVEIYNPLANETFKWQTAGGGRGYQRVPSLVSVWATAPYLHNNEIGMFTGDPSVQGRMAAFDDSIRKMLHIKPRGKFVHRTSQETSVKVSPAVLPTIGAWLARAAGLVNDDGMIEIGPIPKGTPVNLISNMNLDRNDPRVSTLGLLSTGLGLGRDLKQIHKKKLNSEQAAALLMERVPELIERSACPDFIVDRGHDFGKDLPPADKEALIEYIKTL
jgi:hypothetical protein